MAKKIKKIFVLDTNVILHDSSCIHQFEEHDIVIPITVLEELDNFKKGNDEINFHAREFSRTLDSISGNKLFNGGVKLGEKKGKISIKLEQDFHPYVALNFPGQKHDHKILNVVYLLSQSASRKVIFVSKDVNLRMKSKAIGIHSQDYKTDHVKDISALYGGSRTEEIKNDKLIDTLYEHEYSVTPDQLPTKKPLIPNEYIIIKNCRKSALAKLDSEENVIKRVEKVNAYQIKPKNAQQIFALDALLDRSIRLVSICGKAGSGKTLLALAAALERKKYYRQIYMARPIIPLSNKDIGYLPGDIHSKIDPYMQPLYDNLGVIQNQFTGNDPKHTKIKQLLDEKKLVITPLAYIRGRSLVKIFFIVDEAQNLTPHEIKTIITRAGEGTKMIFTGDIFQIDHPYLDAHSNGLSYLIEKMKGQKIYAHVNLKKGERSELAELASNLL